jgi:hypothetical protein
LFEGERAAVASPSWMIPTVGAVAQLGERVNGIHEVSGSIPLGSTNEIKDLLE